MITIFNNAAKYVLRELIRFNELEDFFSLA
jgi:hypothetical protein